MKLIKCHIEDYGKFHDADFAFDGSITQFCEENGYGKTTLASFIKAMFYGMPAVKSNTKDFTDRTHFYPWSGGKYGGNITFEMGGDKYRIERFFGRASDKDDTLAVFVNNKKTNKLGKEPGKTVFGLDKESFERTSFITADAMDICATSGISAKLNNFVDNTDPENTFDAARARLEKSKKRLKAAKGDNDLISKKRSEIVELRAELGNIEAVADALDGLYEESTELNEKISEAEALLQRANAVNLYIEKWDRYESLLERKAQSEAEKTALEGKYPFGLPAPDELSELKECNRKIIELGGQKQAAGFTDAKQLRLSELEKQFEAGEPNADVMKSVQDDIGEIKNLETEIAAQRKIIERPRLAELDKTFEKYLPSDDETAAAQEKADRLRVLDDELKLQMNLVPAEVCPEKTSAKMFIIFAAVAGLIAATGIGVVFASAIAGGILMGVGAVMLGVIGFMYLKSRSAAAHPFIMSDEIVERQEERRRLEIELKELLEKTGYSSQSGIAFDFATLKKDRAEYLSLVEQKNAAQKSVAEMTDKREGLIEKTKRFLAGYGYTGADLQEMHLLLFACVTEYKNLKNDVVSSHKASSDIDGEIAALYEKAKGLLEPYKLSLWESLSVEVETLEKASAEIARLTREIADIDGEARAYKEKHELSEKPVEQKTDVDALAENLAEMRKQSAALDGRIADAEEKTEQAEAKRAALALSERTLDEYLQKYDVLSAAAEMLDKAEQNLKDAYIAPIRDHFLQYTGAIENALGEKISMDGDFRITFERGGENRSDKHLGAGQRSICALCFRLALVDNMYKDEQPFIIMDDPFVHLDAEHMDKTLATVKALAEQKQIVYFCCHESRKVSI